MADEDYRAAAVRLLIEGYSRGNPQVLDELVAPTFTDHGLPDGFPPSAEGTRSFILAIREAMPDLQYTIEDTFLGGGRVAIRVTGQGTMSGPLFGHPASGKKATWTEIHVSAIERGKLVEHWAVIDWLGLFKQFGLIPGIRSVEI
jgi:predicted ester cyclase